MKLRKKIFHSNPMADLSKPQTLALDFDLVRCASLFDLIDLAQNRKRIGFPYWILTPEESVWFEYVKEDTEKEDLSKLISEDLLYISVMDVQSTKTKRNLERVKQDPGLIYKRKYALVRSESLLDFIDPEKKRKIHMMPYWVFQDDGSMRFQYIRPNTDKSLLLRLIRNQVVYVRLNDARAPKTLQNLK